MQQSIVPPGRARRTLLILAGAFALLAIAAIIAVIALRNAAALTAVRSVGRSFGYDVGAERLDLTFNRAVARNIRVRTAAGEPVLEARRIEIAFSVRDLLPGGKRLFGLQSVDIEAPHVTVIHHPDGTYNFTLPQAATNSKPANPAPLDLRLKVTDGSADLIDRFTVAPHERRERLTSIAAAGVLSPASGSFYHAGAVLEAEARRYPIRGNARFDDPHGYELQHWTAADVPIAGLANFLLSTHALNVQGGHIRNFDATIGALSTAAGKLQTHIGASGELAGGRIAAIALTKPVRDARGRFVVDDDSVTVRSLDASLNGLPLHAAGVLYHFSAPQIAFALSAHGDLARAVALSKDSAKLPIRGAVTLAGVAEGPASAPVIFARFRSPQLQYGTYRFDGTRGFVAITGQELDVIDAGLRYGPAVLAGRATALLEKHTRTTGYATFAAPASGLPYGANIVPGLLLHGVAAVGGVDAKLAARGFLAGANAGDRLDAPFALAENGNAAVGPVVLQRRDGATLFARALFDRRTSRTAAVIDVRRLSLIAGPPAALAGLRLPALPAQLDGTIDATAVGVVNGSTLDSASGTLHAAGSWGDVHAVAAGSGNNFAARGRLTTSFERLARFSGNIQARGAVDVPFAVANAGRSTVLQIQDATFPNASVRGIPLQRANLTVGFNSRAIDLYAADLQVAGSAITAAGSFGNGGRVHLTAGDFDLGVLRTAGMPLSGGRASLIADLGGTTAKPTADVRAAVGGARYAQTDIGGDIGVTYDGATANIRRATLTFGGAYAAAAGVIAGLSLRHIAPRYALNARVEDADIATLARVAKNPLRYPQGTLDADVRVGGAGSAPALNGAIRIPEGSLNGLSFRAAQVDVGGTATALRATNGRVTVGTTALAFGASASRLRQSVVLNAPRVDLADFDDYFDEADVLAGRGSIALAVDAAPSTFNTSARIALREARYRRFDFGTISVAAQTVGTTVRLNAAVAGVNGRVAVDGTIDVPRTDPLRDIARRSDVDLRTQIGGIVLGNVLPAAGLTVPVVGVVDGSAVVRGHYPALALTTQVALTKGVVGRVPIERFTLAATAANGHGRLTDLTLAAPGLSANASGTFGVRPNDPFDLRAQLASGNLNELLTTATGKNPSIKGSLATAARVTGTIARPRVRGSVDVTGVTYDKQTISHAHADVDATRAAVDVRNGRIELPLGGSLAFDAHAPLSGGATTPIALDFTPQHVDVRPYSSLLGDGSVVAGVFDGTVGVRGTLAAPLLAGSLTFTRGSYRSNTLKSGLTAIDMRLDFSRTTVRLAKLHFRAAPGNIDGAGTVVLEDLRDPVRGLSADVTLRVSNALFNAPKTYDGYVDGQVTLTKRVATAAAVGGNLTFSSARVPYTALLPSGGSATTAAPVLPAVAFDLGVTVGRDVRVQSGPVDIGTVGTARLGGTLAKPTLDGQFTSTDGTVSLYRTFTVQNGSAVNFDPADGITPSLDATAVTSIPDPPTDVLLRITGPSTHLNLAFSSQPAYSQQQILGLLVNAQALGAVSGVAQSSGGTTNAPSISGIGEGILNTQLTQKFLQPFSSKLGGALGLSDLDLNYNTNGAVSASARRRIGKNISFTYGEQIGGPTPRTSLGIVIGSDVSGAQLTFYQAAGSQQAFGGQALTPFLQSGFLATSQPNYALTAIEPPTGSGFVFSYQRRF